MPFYPAANLLWADQWKIPEMEQEGAQDKKLLRKKEISLLWLDFVQQKYVKKNVLQNKICKGLIYQYFCN